LQFWLLYSSLESRCLNPADRANIQIGLDTLFRIEKFKTPSNLNEELEQSFGNIATEISHFNKISNTIRRASKKGQIIKTSGFKIKDNDGNDLEPLLLGHFEHYIRDRFLDITQVIREGFTHAMLLRRKRILYRRYRQGSTAIKPPNIASKASITFPVGQETVNSTEVKLKKDNNHIAVTTTTSSHTKGAMTLHPEQFRMAASTPSFVSTSKMIAFGSHEALNFPPAPGFAAKRKHKQLKEQRLTEYRAVLEAGEEASLATAKYNNVLAEI
jgi:hypothetical protein